MADLANISNQDLLSALSDDDLRQIAGNSPESTWEKVKSGAKQVGKNIVGMAENAANQASVLSAMTVTAVPNIIGSAGAEVADAIVQERLPTFKGVSDKFHKNIEAQIYQPTTPEGKRQVETTGQVLTAIPQAVDAVDDATGQHLKRNFPNTYAAAQVAGEFAPFVVAGKAIHGALKKVPVEDIRFEVDPVKLAEARRVPAEDIPVDALSSETLTTEVNNIPARVQPAKSGIVTPVVSEIPVKDVGDMQQPPATKPFGSEIPVSSEAKTTVPAIQATGEIKNDLQPGEAPQIADVPSVQTVSAPVAEMRQAQPKIEAPLEGTSIKNAVVEAERIAAGKDPLESKVIRLVPSVAEGKARVESGEVNPRDLAQSLVDKPRPIDATEVGVLLHDRIKIKNELKESRTAIEEARQAGDTVAETSARDRVTTLENAYDINDRASRSAGTEQSAAFRARQLIERDDYSYENVIQRVKTQGDGTVPEATRAKIDELTKRLEAVTREAETQADKIANLEAEYAVKQIAREEGVSRRKGVRRAKAATLDGEYAELSKELQNILNPNRVSMNLDPQAVIVIGKMAKNRVQKGMVRAADIVDDIHKTIGGALDKREIAKIIAQTANAGKSTRKADAVDRKLQSDSNDLKRQIEATVNPMTTGRKVRNMALETWKAGLLSGPKTHIVNITSNALTLAGKPVETVIAAGFDRIRSGARGERQERFIREAAAEVVGLRAGISEGVRRAARAWAEALPDTEAQKFNESRQMHAIPGRVGKTIRIPFRALGAADSFFKAITESSEIHREAYRLARRDGLTGKELESRVAEIISNPPTDLLDMAKHEADYRTFNQELGPAGKWVSKAKEIPVLGVAAELLLPFVRTPLNIAKYGLERTPLNYGRILYKALRGELRGQQLTAELAKPAIGTLITVGVITLAADDMITGGGPKAKAEKDAFYRTGWQPYSLKIGDKYYSYNRFEPIGMIFGTTADFADMIQQREDNRKTVADNASLIAMSIAKNWTSKTFMQGFSAALDAINDPARYGQQFVNGYAGSLIPSIVNTAAQAVDPMRREVKSIGDAMAARVPGLSDELPVKYDLWGRPQEKTGITPVDRALSPVAISNASNDFVDIEMLRLDLHPGMPMKKAGKYEFTPEQYNIFIKTAGKDSYLLVKDILSTNNSDEAKKIMVEHAISTIRERTRKRLIHEWNIQPTQEVQQ
jgi:hypothetical protein